MKVAHILPTQLRHLAQYSDYQMVLAHQLQESPLLQTWVKYVSERAYVMVDNDSIEVHSGDVENETDYWGLMVRMKKYVNEIVLPDVPYEGDATVERAEKHINMLNLAPKVMIVPQGKTYGEYRACLKDLAALVPRAKRTLGINRCSMRWADPMSRCELLSKLKTEVDLTVDIHLLGIHENPQSELETVAKCFPFVRGVDTAAAYAYAQQGIDLTREKNVPPKPSADWKEPFNRNHIHYIARNSVQLELWASS